ncbi:hypothetical protein PENTCL1PPCAC_20624, partial [Pristionchus entomophagus]
QAFPSAFGSISTNNVFAPTPYRDNSYETEYRHDERGYEREERRSNEPEDPANAKETGIPMKMMTMTTSRCAARTRVLQCIETRFCQRRDQA